ncbi:MAG: DUF3887 domain-containing protein [Lachnospiraceae bacterium]|jgi:hypothetical protein|nr:DUF3887 domain-containing protein [Lachnospiraceae bacterium]
MGEKKYVNAVARKLKCDGKRKREIKKQLLADIQMRENQGERLEEIISRMGKAGELADGFNENISVEEQRRYARNKVLKIVIPTVLAVIFIGMAGFWMLPKTVDIEESRVFDKEEVEAAMKETIELLDAEDYDALQKNAIPTMKPLLNAETRENMRRTLSDDWGERKQFGAVYMVEVIQGNSHLAVGEMTVTYENVSVTYRLTYDEDMRFAGIYVR